MPFDTNMYGRIDIQTPNRLGALLDPANMERQRADQMATQEKIAQMQEARTLRDLLAGSPDIGTAQQRLAQAGKWNEAAKLQGVIQQQQQAKVKMQSDMRKQMFEDALYTASLNPTDDAFKAILTLRGVPEDQHQSALASLPQDPEQRRAMIALDPAKRAEMDFQRQKQEQTSAAAMARDEARAEIQAKRDAERFAQQEKLANIRQQGTLAAIGAKQGAAPSGKAPAGYRYTVNGDLEAIPGGPADTKKIAAEEKAKADAQKSIGIADQGIAVIDQLLNDKGLKDITGWASMVPIIPNTDQARADALAKQIEGQSFLQAFQSLKGGGAITNVEGEKASAAIARLQRGQKEKDYRAALTELKGIMQTAKNRAAGGGSPASKSAPFKSKSGAIIEIEE